MRKMKMKPGWKRVVILVSLFLAGSGMTVPAAGGMQGQHGKEDQTGPIALDSSTPSDVHAHYVGSGKCVECHEKEARQWKQSDHARAMMRPSAQSVRGDFNKAEFTRAGVTTRFFKKDGGFYVRTPGADGKQHDYKVAYTFGVYPLQQYLAALPGGRLQVLPVSWDARPKKQGGQRWFSTNPEGATDPESGLFWTRPMQNWNMQCAQCHSTNLKKHYNPENGRYHTTFSQMNVSCESCHGPGSAHVQWARKHQGDATGKGGMGLLVDLSVASYHFVHDSETHLPSRTRPLESQTQLHVCAECHSRRADLTDHPGLGRGLLRTHMPELLESGLYYPDGQVHGEDYVWGSFIQSAMFHQGVRCSDCHNPHTLKLRAPAENGQICLDCHKAQRVAVPAHTHHKPGTPGANCINCHMPAYTAMKIDRRRDHSLRIPRPDLSVQYGVPNACTQCHKQKSDQWAAKWAKKWYGSLATNPPSFVHALAAGREGEPRAGEKLNSAARQADYPAIARASAAEMLGRYPTARSAHTIRSLLQSDSPLLRLGAVKALTGFTPKVRWQLGAHALQDPALAVRIEAARVLAPGFSAHAKGPNADAFAQALADLFRTQHHNADRPSSLVQHGNVEQSLGHPNKAEDAYKRAIARAPGFAAAYVNLADLYRAVKQESDVRKTLRRGLAAAPDSAVLHYALALSNLRLGRRKKVLDPLKQAVHLAPDNTRYLYTYAVALNSLGQPEAALHVLDGAVRKHPGNRHLLIAITTIARDHGERKKAIHYAGRLTQLAPENARYQRLLESLKHE